MPKVVWNDDELLLTELECPFALLQGLQSCRELAALLAQGRIGRTADSVEEWIRDGSTPRLIRQRRQTFDIALSLLRGARIEDADRRFREEYLAHVDHHPRARATRMVLRAIRYDWPDARLVTVSPGDEDIVDLLV